MAMAGMMTSAGFLLPQHPLGVKGIGEAGHPVGVPAIVSGPLC